MRFKQILKKIYADSKEKSSSLSNHLNRLKEIGIVNNDSYGYYLTILGKELSSKIQIIHDMFHNYNSLKLNGSFYDELRKLKSKGLILNMGISLYTNEEIIDIVENFSDFDFIQIPFNLLDNDLKRKKAIKKVKEKNIDIHTRSTFLQGLFFINSNALTDALLPLKPYLQEIEIIKSDYNVTTESLALQYVLQKDYIDYVLVGVETSQQLIDNINLCETESTIPHSKIDKLNVLESHLLNPSNWNYKH